MARSLHLYLDGRKNTPAGARLNCRYERRDGDLVADAGELWYEFQEWPEGLAEDNGDPFLMLGLPMAMEEGRELFLHGTASQSLLANLAEFREYWCCVAPERYQPVAFTVDLVDDDQARLAKPGAAMLFSGGVDAAFTYWRHTRQQAGACTQEIKACVLVDGFARPSFLRRDSFLRSCESVERMMAGEAVQLVRVRTNYRQVEAEPFARQHLHMIGSSGCFLGSCLHLFSGVAGAGLYASTHIYGEALEMLTGTNAVSDRFLASARMRVVHDAAAVPRIEKLACLAEWPAFQQNARVCWTPRDDGMNCGHCEKCLRTILAMLLVSGQVPPGISSDGRAGQGKRACSAGQAYGTNSLAGDGGLG